MTIGIAAAGEGAGRAVLDALARVERLATGALGGFVSVAALDGEGRLLRAEAQRGGAGGLLERGALPAELLAAPRAALMSSGPDRPAPLAQFTPAREGVGLVTGHRFPNARGAGGAPLGLAVLDALAGGADPQGACEAVMAANPRADAGVIALRADGRVGLADSERVARFVDAGAVRLEGPHGCVAVLHNAIRPSGALAGLVAEMVAAAMAPRPAGAAVALGRGVPVRPAARSGVAVAHGRAVAIEIATPWHGDVPWTAGLGPGARVTEGGRTIGHLAADPFLVIREGRLVSADGRAALDLPFVAARRASVARV